MINLDNKAYFWSKFDENNNPIKPRECHLYFRPHTGGKLTYLMDDNAGFTYDEYKDKTIQRLYGQAKNGEKFTLVNLKFLNVSSDIKFNGLSLIEIDFSIEYIFYGEWLTMAELKFQGIYVRYSYMEAWFNKMKVAKLRQTGDAILSEITVQTEQLRGSTQDFSVIFNINNDIEQSSKNGNSVDIRFKNLLAMARKELMSLAELLVLADQIKNFFEIVTFPSRKKIFIEELKIKEKLTNNQVVKVLFQQEDYIEEEEISPTDFLFEYRSIQDNFVQILNNWIDNQNKNENEYRAFCNVISDNKKFNIYSHFFQLVSALEGYHRKNNIINEVAKKENEQFIEELGSKISMCVDLNTKNKVLKKLKYDYQPTLRERILDMIEKYSITTLIKIEPETIKLIIDQTLRTRNDIAHSKKPIKIDGKLKNAYEFLKLLSLSIMINEIGLGHQHLSKHVFDIYFEYLEQNIKSIFIPKETKCLTS